MLPCGHAGICTSCAKKIQELPVLQAGDNTFPENILLNNILLDTDMLVDFF